MSMSLLIECFEERYRLGVPQMDDTHREFVTIINRLGVSAKAVFIPRFGELVRHTELHFAAEDALMQASAFPAMQEHMDEHRRVLGDLQRLLRRVEAGATRMGRAYVTEQLPDWFRVHVATMDSALAAHLGRGTSAMPSAETAPGKIA